MKIKIFFFIVSNIFYLQASLIDRSLRFLENPAEKAVVNQSISNIQVHLEGQMTSKYWNYLQGEKEVDLSCLMNERNNNEAARVLGLLPQNVRSIEKMIKTFKMQDPNIGDIPVVTFAFSRVPNFIESEYENRTSEYIEAYLKMKYGQSSSQENENNEDNILRYPEFPSTLALLALKKAYKEKRGHEKHWFVKKVANSSTSANNDAADTNKKENKAVVRLSLSDRKEMEEVLYDVPKFFKHIHYISDDYIRAMRDNQAKDTDSLDIDASLDNQFKYIIFPVQLRLNGTYKRRLGTILHASKENNSVTVVAAWNDTIVKIESDNMLPTDIKNLICLGNNIQVISDHFINNFEELENLDLDFGQSVEEIGKNFLYRCIKLKYLDLSQYTKVKKIKSNFLRNCSALEKLDVGFGENLEEIETGFLFCSGKLRCLDLSRCTNVKTIGNFFLDNCTALEKLDVGFGKNLKEIGSHFLWGCNNLKYLDLSKCHNVKAIGSCFLDHCTALEKLDVGFGKNLEETESHFLCGCNNLKYLDLSRCTNVKKIGNCFLEDCTALEKLDVGFGENLEEIGKSFLSSCCKLRCLDLSRCANVKKIGSFFLSHSSALEKLDVGFGENLEEIGQFFLSSCCKLRFLDLSRCTNVKTISRFFLNNCSELEKLDVGFGKNLEEIESHFLCGCNNLKYLDLSRCTNVKKIDHCFLENCTALEKLDVGFGENLEEIGKNFCYRCNNLKYLDLSKCHNVETIGIDFLYDCLALREIIVSKKIYDLLIERDPKFFEQFKNLQPDKIKVVDSEGILTFPQVK